MALDLAGISNNGLTCASHSAAVDLTGSVLGVRRRTNMVARLAGNTHA
jgi:hypothetical protein